MKKKNVPGWARGEGHSKITKTRKGHKQSSKNSRFKCTYRKASVWHENINVHKVWVFQHTVNIENTCYQGTLYAEHLRQYLTLVFVKIFPNVLQSLQKNLENSWTQAVDATLILPTISISCGSLKETGNKRILNTTLIFLLLSIYICIHLLLIFINTCKYRALLALIQQATSLVQLLTQEESKEEFKSQKNPTHIFKYLLLSWDNQNTAIFTSQEN